jgi:hypothetical protein
MGEEDHPENTDPNIISAQQEGASEQAAQGLGEAAVVAVDPSIDPEHHELSEDEKMARQEQDPDRAYDMAHASDDFRTKAVDSRQLEERKKSIPNELVAALNARSDFDDMPKPSVLHPLARRQHEAEARQKQIDVRDAREIEDVRSRSYNAANRVAIDTAESDYEKVDDGAFFQPSLVHPEDRAKFYDVRAEAIEEWAGILHDHPVSPEYIAAHPDVDFTPQGLLRMEAKQIRLGRELKSVEERIKKEIGFVRLQVDATGYNPPNPNGIKEVRELLAEADEEQAKAWDGLIAEAGEASSQMTDMHKKLLEEVRVNPLQRQIGQIEQVLNDVSSGHTTGEQESSPQE